MQNGFVRLPADGDELFDVIHFLPAVDHHHGDGPQHLVEALQGIGELALSEELVRLLQLL